jgi:sugar phosphate isomerase/epimerase
MDVERRSLLTGLAAGLAGAAITTIPTEAHDHAATRSATAEVHGSRQPEAHRWGVQLYTVRTQIEADPRTTLRQIAAIGYKELEVLQPTLTTVAPLAAPLGLAITSVHLDGPTAGGDGYETFLGDAKRFGLRYVVVPFVPPAKRPTDRAGFDVVAARLTGMARAASAAGLQLCYHNHAFEFGQDTDGTRWLEVLMRGTAEAGMQLELDVFWAAFAGADPVALLQEYKGRVALVHLKDRHPRGRTALLETAADRSDFVEVGAGALDFPAILAAAREAGVRHYFVEQDEAPGDPVESLTKSYAYLAGLPKG